MLNIIKTTNQNSDFIELVKELDAELAVRDGDDHDFYNQFNKIDTIRHCLIAYLDNIPVGCGAIKEYDNSTMEIKRMYTKTTARGNGVASQILQQLENWARELGYQQCILETGINQPEAIALYNKCNYKRMEENYGQYKGVAASFCFKKKL
jgi:putative acetyltransferase